MGVSVPQEAEGKVLDGTVKFYSPAKRFGFIRDSQGEDHFVHESKIPVGLVLEAGMKVKFETKKDSRGRNAAAILDDSEGQGDSAEMETMRCFSMSQPFVALLLNGIKTVESRNKRMFMNVAAGTKVLLHCGQRDWKDMDAPVRKLQEAGFSHEEIKKLSELPKGFRKGSIVGVMTVGQTWDSSEKERMEESLQRKVVADFENIGRFCTPISDAKWLKQPIRARGNVGVYNAEVPGKCIA
eukprot:CAMPEP_0118677608 /NCGR_PEP_ID=MMETSP0800-20121206/2726_1 /TAXON_ID=210618 ORGANISM="Striatella unipunctata, Strain CCMP2910" /NCGR_SAMPLE_ID=MMETSP0800 /ASSEMBLY_ACC=CAM_ASM_000638 /LENGTH=239 /DNA_ID=CAMNT_0006573309 /DNA_START=633 /DNA_END=1352 /DNA_ORIENTATION=+